MNRWLVLRRILKVGDERGAVLIAGLLIIVLLAVLALAGMMSTSAELKISANDRSAKQVFYVAEAGTEDARSRLQIGASSSPIPDSQPTNPNWTAFIGTAAEASLQGYTGSSDQILYSRLSTLDYVVTITHKKNPSGQILKWGFKDGILKENTSVGNNIFVIKSLGQDTTGASKSVQIEATNVDLYAPAALYTRETTSIQGTSTYIQGRDQCGNGDVDGVLSMQNVQKIGNPFIDGSPQPVDQNSSVTIDVPGLVNGFKSYANYTYTAPGQTLTGMNWGSPTDGATPQNAMSCSAHNVVYINTNSTFVQLAGMSQGCGLLLVDGDLLVQGGFHWYGVVLVSGSLTFTGGGEKDVTGAMLAGANAAADVVGGNANILYCSSAIYDNSRYLALRILRWAETFG
jgi:Tfp pilus assembly protein PilX